MINNKALLAVQEVTAQQLESGDIAIYTWSATEIVRKFKDQWLPRFGRAAYVQTMTYGVLVHGVPYSFLESLGAD